MNRLSRNDGLSLVHGMLVLMYLAQSFQDWQSEFLAASAMVVFSALLRQEGAAESKGVTAPQSEAAGRSCACFHQILPWTKN